jgi:hypothetical protein
MRIHFQLPYHHRRLPLSWRFSFLFGFKTQEEEEGGALLPYYVVVVVVVVEGRRDECAVAFRPHFLETLEKLVHHFDRRRWSCCRVCRPAFRFHSSSSDVVFFLIKKAMETQTHTHTQNIIQEME